MQNYYRFRNITDISLSNIQYLTTKANQTMWRFQISEIDYLGKHSYNEWQLPINAHNKIVVIANPESLNIFRGSNSTIDCSESPVYFIPSYILFKCKNAHIFYANGNTLM